MAKPQVLVIDDSITIRMDLKESLEEAGFATCLCATAAGARNALAKSSFDLIILDVVLPDGDGIEFLGELKSSRISGKMPVMLLSSEAEVRNRVRGLKTGADEYLGKPYDIKQVVARARELIRSEESVVRERAMVLVIDDSATFRSELKAVLQAAGYDVVEAASGEDGLQRAIMARPDAIIVDGMLPGLDGIEVIRKVRADSVLRRTPCLLLTASERDVEELRALEAGADTFVQKKQDPGVILAKLGVLLRAGRLPSQTGTTASLLAPKRVLTVDDSLTYLEKLSSELREEGYDVVGARSGEEALELLAVQPVNAILLDMVMPGLSGKETCRRIKSNAAWRDIPLLILTALEEEAAMLEGINAGADDYITKASDFNVLKARLNAQLRRRQFEEESQEIREQLMKRELEAVELQAVREIAETRAALIADLEKKNEELRCAKEAADALSKELEAFSYSVSHDLRAPLRHIDGFAGLLREHARSMLDEEGLHYLETISNGSKRMNKLIEDLLAFSRINHAEMEPVTVQLQGLVADILREMQNDFAHRKIEWKIGALPSIQGDPAMLRQAFVNLVSNAVKYTGTRTEARIEIDSTDNGKDVTFFIRDNGVGFDMKYAGKLFGVFQRLHRAEEFEGTGIGLANVSRIVQRHGGKIWAEGLVDKGATFFVCLPKNQKRH